MKVTKLYEQAKGVGIATLQPTSPYDPTIHIKLE